MNNETVSSQIKTPKHKPSTKICLIFSLIVFTNILINLDHGIIPAGIFT